MRQKTEKNKDELEHVASLVRMTQRGMNNQAIPKSHEVSIEADRLLAMVYEMMGENKEATEHHAQFFEQVATLGNMFDPVAKASQLLEYARVSDDVEMKSSLRQQAIQILQAAIGRDHPWVTTIDDGVLCDLQAQKRRKLLC